MSSDNDTPIDPELLDEEIDEYDDQSSEEQHELSPNGGDSSGTEDNDSDAYIDEDQEGDDVPFASSSSYNDDAVFSRLAGFVGRSGDTGEIGLQGLNIEQEIALADAEDQPEGSRQPRRSTRKPRKQHKPSHEVQKLVGQANIAYARGETQRTISLFLEVIRHDPYVISAWNTLASVYEEEENQEGARQMRFFAAHVEDEPEAWKELALEFRQRGQIAQCIYCLRKVLGRDPGDVGTLFELASILRLQNQASKAVDAFKKILRLHSPSSYDFTFLAQFHPLILQSTNVSLASSCFRTAFDYHITHFASPEDPSSTMTLAHMVTLVDDLSNMEELEEAVVVIRRGQRWLQGRSDQSQWDVLENDREYDPPGLQREGDDEESGRQEGYHLETALRHRLALLRLKLGDDDEAMIHIEEVLSLDVLQYHDLFLEIGNALLKREMYEKALECFAVIQEADGVPDSPPLIFSIAICHHQMNELSQALDALQWVISVDNDNLEAKLRLANVLEDMGSKAEALEIVSEVIRERAQRGERGRGADDSRLGAQKQLNKGEKAGQRKLVKKVLEDQMKSKMQNLWLDVQSAEEGIQSGELDALDRFIQAAGTMIENFRLARSNFTKNRGVVRILKQRKYGRQNDLTSQALALQDRLERAMGFDDDAHLPEGAEASSDRYLVWRITEFYGLGCEEWLNLVIKYCAVLMVKNEEDVAVDILEHVVYSGLFNNPRCEVAIRMTIVACAIRIKSYERIVDNCKRIGQLHQFRNEPFLLLLASLRGGGIQAVQAWQSLPYQKYIHRDLRTQDDIVKGRKTQYSSRMGRWSVVLKIGLSRRLGDEVSEGEDQEDNRDEEALDDAGEAGETEGIDRNEEETPKPTKFSPTLNVLYGQYMLSTRAYQSALFYLFRAYEITQQDPLICLMIAQAFFGRAGNRQVDNRNYMITQGLAFLTKYRKLSAKDPRSQEEVEYNYGRSFHGIGVTHLAIEHYERILKSVSERMQQSGDPEGVKDGSLALEAAHNLMQLYAATGNVELVRQRSAWLAI